MHDPVITTGNGSPAQPTTDEQQIIRFPGYAPEEYGGDNARMIAPTTPTADGNAVTVQHVIDAYLALKKLEVQSGAIGPRTLEKYALFLGTFAADYGATPIVAAKPRTLTEWLLLHPEWRATSTKSGAIMTVMSCFKAAVEDELILRNPFRRPKHLGPPVQPRGALTRAEFLAIKNACRRAVTSKDRPCRNRNYFRAFLDFLWHTGSRTCEARTAKWTDIDWENAVIVLEKHKTANKTGESRVIPILAVLPLLRFLLKHRKAKKDGTFADEIFVNSLGKPFTRDRVCKQFAKFALAAGVDKHKTAYCTRHSLCSRLVEAGNSDQAVANVLGHKNTKLIQWYSRSLRGKASHLNDTMRRRKKKAE